MKLSTLITSFFALTIFLFAESLSGKTVYVKSFKGVIKSSPTGEVIANVDRGTQLDQVGQQGFWAKVQYQGKTGFISSLFISASKPASQVVKFDQLRNPNVIARRRASAEVTAASARGAADENEMVKMRGGTLKESQIDLTEVKNMETFEIPSQDLEKFMTEGNIKPQ